MCCDQHTFSKTKGFAHALLVAITEAMTLLLDCPLQADIDKNNRKLSCMEALTINKTQITPSKGTACHDTASICPIWTCEYSADIYYSLQTWLLTKWEENSRTKKIKIDCKTSQLQCIKQETHAIKFWEWNKCILPASASNRVMRALCPPLNHDEYWWKSHSLHCHALRRRPNLNSVTHYTAPL